MNARLLLVLVVGLLCLILRPDAEAVRGCAVAPPKGAYVQVAEESAIIVWDAATKTQHFIRRATFATQTSDFGFLVPTPTQPALGEASDDAFRQLEEMTKPEVIVKKRAIWRHSTGRAEGALAEARAPGGVVVLDAQRVAGYDAVVLAADNVAALNEWLGKHGYAARPDLTAWLEPYVKARWKLTAFKIARDAKASPTVATSAVRMTFTADQPLFPYSEPAGQREPAREPQPFDLHGSSRLLRVFFLGDKRMEGKLGDGTVAWPGRVAWAGPLKAATREQVLAGLKVKAAPTWLTVFEDSSSPRPGTADVFFSPSLDQSLVKRPPIIQYEDYFTDEPTGATSEQGPAGVALVSLVAVGVLIGLVAIGAVIWLLVRGAARAE
jgi:hypothetical protein